MKVPTERFDEIVNDEAWKPFFGWHGDHVQFEKTAAYLPAIQQSRAEFFEFTEAMLSVFAFRSRPLTCLQLGLGPSGCSHALWHCIFDEVLTIERDANIVANFRARCPSWANEVLLADTGSNEALRFARNQDQPFDLIFVDAGHRLEEVRNDWQLYATLGHGIIALHDACYRPTYGDEIGVYLLVQELERQGVHFSVIDMDGIGIAWHKL